jgi:hypothetical protein
MGCGCEQKSSLGKLGKMVPAKKVKPIQLGKLRGTYCVVVKKKTVRCYGSKRMAAQEAKKLRGKVKRRR